jgi:hypothetical protein
MNKEIRRAALEMGTFVTADMPTEMPGQVGNWDLICSCICGLLRRPRQHGAQLTGRLHMSLFLHEQRRSVVKSMPRPSFAPVILTLGNRLQPFPVLGETVFSDLQLTRICHTITGPLR